MSSSNEQFKRGLSIGLSLGGAQVVGGDLTPDWLSAADGVDNVSYGLVGQTGACGVFEPEYIDNAYDNIDNNKLSLLGEVVADMAGNISTANLKYTNSSDIMNLYSSLYTVGGLGVSYNRNRYNTLYLLNIDDIDKIKQLNIEGYIACKSFGNISNIVDETSIYVNKNKSANTTNHKALSDNEFKFEYIWTPGSEPSKFNCVAYSCNKAYNTEIFYPLGNAVGADGVTYTGNNMMRSSNKLLRYVSQSSTVYDIYSYDVFTGIEVHEGTFYAPSASYMGRFIVSEGTLYCLYSNKLYKSTGTTSSGWKQLASISTTSGRTTAGCIDILGSNVYVAYSGVSSSSPSTAPTIYIFNTETSKLTKHDVPTTYNNYFRSNKIQMIDDDTFRIGFINSSNSYVGSAIYKLSSSTFSYDYDMLYFADFTNGTEYITFGSGAKSFYYNTSGSGGLYKADMLGATCISYFNDYINAQSTGVGLSLIVNISY